MRRRFQFSLRALLWSADEIHRQHPHLALAEVHAAMGYYYDNQAQIDAEITLRHYAKRSRPHRASGGGGAEQIRCKSSRRFGPEAGDFAQAGHPPAVTGML